MEKGKILGFSGSWGSGIATLTVKNLKTGKVENIPTDNAPTVRALESAYGNIISAGRTANINKIKGKVIFYDYTDWGSLAGFVPEEEAPAEVVEAWEKSKKKLRKVV